MGLKMSFVGVDRKTLALPNPRKSEEKKRAKWAVWIGLRVTWSGNSVCTKLTWAGPGGENWTDETRNPPALVNQNFVFNTFFL
jgi:hypothetical protein